MANIILWVYIVLLVVGGMIGFFKAGSRASLISSVVSAAILAVAAVGILSPSLSRPLADLVMVVLLVVFAMRLAKTKKFMPSGIMLAMTLLALVLRHL